MLGRALFCFVVLFLKKVGFLSFFKCYYCVHELVGGYDVVGEGVDVETRR